jgi:hypothetical protein
MSGPINGVPAVYELDGRQYLAVCVGAAGAADAEESSAAPAAPVGGSEYVVFALKR